MLTVALIMAFAFSGCSLITIYNQYDRDSSVEDSSMEDSSSEEAPPEDSSDWDGWTDFY